jgi:NADPH2 dehydrogenase
MALKSMRASTSVLILYGEQSDIKSPSGSLIEQFIQDVVNRRSDNYGGSIVNRTRFLFEVVQAVVDEIGVNRTGIRFSPWSKGQGKLCLSIIKMAHASDLLWYIDMGMKNPVPTYTHIIAGLAEQHPELAYIHMIEPGINSADDGTTQELDEGVTVG